MAGLMERPSGNLAPSESAVTSESLATQQAAESQALEQLLSTRSPQRPQRTPTFYVEIDGKQLEAFEGQTILEVCRANGIEVPTLCYDPKLPGFGACRMCVVDVEGCDAPLIKLLC